MKHIHLTSPPIDRDFSKSFLDDCDYDTLFDEDVTVFKPSGEPLFVLLKKSIPEPVVAQAWSALKDLNPTPSNNRGTATGISSEKWRRTDGSLSGFMRVPRGWTVDSFIIGYFGRTVRNPYCRACSWNADHPELFRHIIPMAKRVSHLFETHVPGRFSVQKDYASRTSPDFLIPETVFTTLTVNKNFRTACHKDVGDLEAGFSCLSVIRRGAFRGGNLVLPAWRIAAKLDTCDLAMFDAHEFHGNTQIIPLTKDAMRCSVVYYYREDMIQCGSVDQELERLRKRSQGQPLWD